MKKITLIFSEICAKRIEVFVRRRKLRKLRATLKRKHGHKFEAYAARKAA